MEIQDPSVEEELPVRRVESEKTVELVVDFGQGVDPSVDVVGETVVVIAGGEQYEIESGGDAQAFISNGVLTIEVDK